MPTLRTLLPALLLAAAPFAARGQTPVEPPAAPVKPAPGPRYVDDDEVMTTFTAKLAELAKKDKCLGTDKVKKLTAADRAATLEPARPGKQKLDPEEVYERAAAGVFVIGSVVPDEKADGEFVQGRAATAWVLAADGVLVTNWHVFDGVEKGELFGAMSRDGDVYPLTDVLAVNKRADIAVVKVAAKNLTPLPVADAPAPVGSWVGVLGHPGDRYYTFTQGHVTRYSKVRREEGAAERWMSIDADYAYGSSGSPVLNRAGAVVGMAAMTENVDYPEPEAKPADPANPPPPVLPPEKGKKVADPKDKEPEKKPDPPKADPPVRRESLVQMVVKLTVPAAEIRKAVVADGGK